MSETNLIPIVLGITGHRDLREEDVPELEKKVDSIFDKLKTKYPHSPLILLSPLAEGADRLAARIALKYRARLVVPLPMAKEEYEKDFITPQSLTLHRWGMFFPCKNIFLTELILRSVLAFFFFELYAHLIQESLMLALYPAILLFASVE